MENHVLLFIERYRCVYYTLCIMTLPLLAHLAHSAKVSFWDRAVSVVRRRASCVVRRPSCVNNLLKHLLLQNH